MKTAVVVFCLVLVGFVFVESAPAQDVVAVGLNYPKTGPYAMQGADQLRAAEMAVDEINAAGGILGKPVKIVWRDSQSKVDVTRQNVNELIDDEKVAMVFGGVSSGVAIESGKICQEKSIPFFATLSYSTETTCEEGHRFLFRECYDGWMGARAIAAYLKDQFPGKKYFYVTADYTWGWTTEAAVRKLTGTDDKNIHKGIRTPFPSATEADFKKALAFAKMIKPDVLVLVLFGKDMELGVRQATAQGLKASCQIVVPNLTLGMAEGGGPKVMEGVVGALPWCWNVPYKYDYPKGKAFVEKYEARYSRYPSTAGASAYTILVEYKDAVERAGTLDSAAVVKALEGHKYTRLKDEQVWRDFDHQSVQTVYAVRCKPEREVLRDKYKLDYFEILSSMSGEEAAITRDAWNTGRQAAGLPTHLEALPGE